MKGSHLYVPHPIKITDANVYTLEGTQGRATHLMSLSKGFRDFMFFTVDIPGEGHKFYLEEMTGGRLSVVEDQEEWEELCAFARRHGAGVTKAG